MKKMKFKKCNNNQMKTINAIILLLLMPFAIAAQDTLSLMECHQLAEENYPLIKQKELIKQYEEKQMEKLDKNFLPSVDLNARATYQSDVTEITLDMPPNSPIQLDMPEISKDSYKATLDVTQLIYDGGATRSQRKVEKADAELKQQNLEAELYKIKEQVNNIYFNAVLLQKQEGILESAKETLKSVLKKLESGYEHGAVLKSDVQVMKAELIQAEQSLAEVKASKQAAFQMLSEYINKNIDTTYKMQIPEMNVDIAAQEITRPELKAFELSKEKINTSKILLSAKNRPIISGFGQAGYGRPGLNMLSDEFSEFYMVGINFSWKLWDWKKTSTEKELLDINANMINSQKETFVKNIHIALKRDVGEILKYREQLEMDKQIIELRAEIAKTAESQLDNGVITSADYIKELNNETQAKLKKEINKIKLEMAKISYLNNCGKL